MNNFKQLNISTIRNFVLTNKDNAKKFIVDNLPNIFSGCALASLGGAVFFTAKGMHEADDVLYTEMSNRIIESGSTPTVEEALDIRDKFTIEDKVKLTWRKFIPAGLATTAAVLFVVASNRAGHEKYMGMLGAYELTKKAFDDYRNSAEDILGEEKAQEIDNAAVTKRVDIPANCFAYAIPNVDRTPNPTLFVEYYTGTAFYASQETVYHAFNYANNKRNRYESVSVGELLEDMGVNTSMIHGADTFYWKSFDQNEYSSMLEPRWTSGFLNGNEAMPCTIIGYNIDADTVPTEHYWK